MEVPLQITFRGMKPSEALEANIREKADKLESLFDRIIGCNVIVEAPHRHKRKGKLYEVHIDLSVPGKVLVVAKKPGDVFAHEDVFVSVRDAFDAATRQLQDHARQVRGDVKTHEVPRHGKIARIFPAEGYGFIESSEGREIYFHRNSVVGDAFSRIKIGQEVRFVVAEGESEKGPQATTVHLVGKHHIVD